MAVLGMNVDAIGTYDPRELAHCGVRWVRLVAKADPDQRSYLDRCKQAGIRTLLVIASESVDGMSWGDAAQLYAQRYAASIDALQVGNEPDIESPSSWTMKTDDLNRLLATFRGAFPNVFLIGPGLASGQPQRFDGANLSLLNAIGVHPYGQGLPDWPSPYGFPSHIGALLDNYAALGKPIFITEWGAQDRELGQDQATEYVSRMLKYLLARADIPVAFYFCWSDAMVPGFGLCGGDGGRKSSFRAFVQAAGGSEQPFAPPVPLTVSPPTPPVAPAPATSGARFVLGFARWAALEPALIGQPVLNEWGPTDGMSQQLTTTGLLTWASLTTGPVLTFYSFADRAEYVWREDWPASRRVAS
jgi:hypothetical protein